MLVVAILVFGWLVTVWIGQANPSFEEMSKEPQKSVNVGLYHHFAHDDDFLYLVRSGEIIIFEVKYGNFELKGKIAQEVDDSYARISAMGEYVFLHVPAPNVWKRVGLAY